MSWQYNGRVKNQFPEVGPDFPHAWTFSAQRYVPRPRPVARIILPSHQRSSSPVRPEVPSHAIIFSRSDCLQPLLKVAHEGDNLARFGENVWARKFWSLCKRLSKFAAAVKEKTVDSAGPTWMPVRNFWGRLRR